MNLQENIKRIKSMMGLILESNDCCKINNFKIDSVKIYWENTNMTQDQKLKEIKTYTEKILKEVKDYYFNYINGEMFLKKIKDKINSTPDSGNKSISDWKVKEKNELKTFITNIKINFLLDSEKCSSEVGGYVSNDNLNIINLCCKNMYPDDDNTYVTQVLTHEMKHSLNYYFKKLGIDILPEDVITNDKYTDYTTDHNENSSRVQNLRKLLGLDDFMSFDNLVSIFKNKLKIKILYKEDLYPTDIKFTNDMIIINTNFNFHKIEKPLVSKYIKIFFDNTQSQDVSWLFQLFSTSETTNDQTTISVNLKKLFSYSQEFVSNNDTENNYG